jgi:hypothetical protein
MIRDGTYTAVVDRLDEETATLVIEPDDSLRHVLRVSADALPEEARTPDAVVRCELVDGTPESVDYDAAATDRRLADLDARFDHHSRHAG